MKKIVVPEGMLKAAHDEAIRNSGQIGKCLEAALLWLSENPIVPHARQLRLVESAAAHEPINSTRWMSDVLVEWQRCCFLAHNEPEQEDYADRILKNASPGYTPTHAELDKIWEHVFLAGHGWVPPEMRKKDARSEVPEEVKDLLANTTNEDLVLSQIMDNEWLNRRIVESFRRGQKAVSK